MRINKFWYLWVVGGLLVILIFGTILAYSTNIQFLQKIYPVAMVGSRFVSLQAFHEHQAVAAKLDSSFSQTDAFNQLIKVFEEWQLVDSLNISVTGKDFDQELAFLKTVKDNQYNQVLQKYFANDPRVFNNEMVTPRVYDKLLKIKYNSDFNANLAAYLRVQDILAQIKAGKKFEDLALIDSDDKITGQLGGDLGFVSLNQILPELADKVIGLKVGAVSDQIAVSRLGYQILYLVETSQKNGQTLYHLKHILVQTTGYDNWLNGQLKNFHVWKIVQD